MATCVYGWTMLGIAWAHGGGEGGPIAIAALLVLVVLLVVDSIVYYGSGGRHGPLVNFLGVLGTFIPRGFFVACVVVGPFWIVDQLVAAGRLFD